MSWNPEPYLHFAAPRLRRLPDGRTLFPFLRVFMRAGRCAKGGGTTARRGERVQKAAPRVCGGMNDLIRIGAAAAAAAVLAGCAAIDTPPPNAPERREFAIAVTQSNQLVRFNAARPDRMLWRKGINGLQPGEQVLGIDFRVKNDTLYAVGSSGRLYTIDTETGAAAAVGAAFAVAVQGSEVGFDFNPVVDRIRVVAAGGQNLRLHPDTGAVVDANPESPGVQTDGALAFTAGDANAGKAPRVVAAAYTYNKADPKITTNFALDAATASLVTQGSREGVQPAVSPNTGRLQTVGALQAGAFDGASFDIHVITDVAFAALSTRGERTSRWVEVDLATGRARPIGRIAAGEPVRAVALESW